MDDLTPRQIAAKVKAARNEWVGLNLPGGQMKISVVNANILSAFDDKTIGAKVVNPDTFNDLLLNAIEHHDFSGGPTPGQAVLDLVESMPDSATLDWEREAMKSVSSGVGERRPSPDDYVCRIHRGQVHMFLKREFASPVTMLSAVVYTRDGYLNDPDVKDDQREKMRIIASECSHVLVAVLATCVKSFVSPHRFVANLAGANHDYDEGKMTHSELATLAKSVLDFDDHWSVVAD